MTVLELIAILQKYPPDAVVTAWNAYDDRLSLVKDVSGATLDPERLRNGICNSVYNGRNAVPAVFIDT